MGFNLCPADVVSAPVESVWELLADPGLYDRWWDARTLRIAPQGPASPGQVISAETARYGRKWALTLRVEQVDPAKHQIRLHAVLPLGTVNDATITGTALDATTCRVQFG